jgi:hypothetical protein
LYWYYIFLCIDISMRIMMYHWKHVGRLCLWITYNFILYMCWFI